MKHNQQYPARDECPVKGTFFLDWTQDPYVALYFASLEASTAAVRICSNNGALFLCDVSATGRTLQVRRVEDIIDLMVMATQEGRPFGCPLIFHPPKQTHMERALRQKAVYWAQMDLRYDLEYIWTLQEERQGKGNTMVLGSHSCVALSPMMAQRVYQSRWMCAPPLPSLRGAQGRI